MIIMVALLFISPFFKPPHSVSSFTGNNSQEYNDFNQITQWIRDNTNIDHIFLVNPCKAEFWLKSQRAMLVNFKAAPAGNEFATWYQRIIDSNGGEKITGVGFQLCREIKLNFERLSIHQLQTMRNKYNVRYYLLETERQDLVNGLIISNRNYYLYDINSLKETKGR
jgi:hypothetical protein